MMGDHRLADSVTHLCRTEGPKILNWCFTISSSSRRAQMALSLLETSSSRYWYLSFFLARHSRALWRLRSSFAFRSIFAGLRPRFPGFFTFPPTIWEEEIFDHLLIKNPSIFLEGRLCNRLRWDGLVILGPMWNGLLIWTHDINHHHLLVNWG